MNRIPGGKLVYHLKRCCIIIHFNQNIGNGHVFICYTLIIICHGVTEGRVEANEEKENVKGGHLRSSILDPGQ